MAVYDTLIRLDAVGNVQPGLATSWAYNADHTEFTMKLRPGVVFHDGTKLTADVVKRNFDRDMALGNRAYLSGLNIVGLQRRGFSRADIHDLRRAYRLLFAAEGTLVERMDDVAVEFAGHASVEEILAFIREGGKRSLCTPKNGTES